MSVENLKEYARRCANDPELRAAARDIGMTDMNGHMRQAESLGLAWTMDDLAAFRKEIVDTEGDLADMSEEDLEQVAGGVVTATAAAIAVGALAVSGVAVGASTAMAGSGW